MQVSIQKKLVHLNCPAKHASPALLPGLDFGAGWTMSRAFCDMRSNTARSVHAPSNAPMTGMNPSKSFLRRIPRNTAQIHRITSSGNSGICRPCKWSSPGGNQALDGAIHCDCTAVPAWLSIGQPGLVSGTGEGNVIGMSQDLGRCLDGDDTVTLGIHFRQTLPEPAFWNKKRRGRGNR